MFFHSRTHSLRWKPSIFHIIIHNLIFQNFNWSNSNKVLNFSSLLLNSPFLGFSFSCLIFFNVYISWYFFLNFSAQKNYILSIMYFFPFFCRMYSTQSDSSSLSYNWKYTSRESGKYNLLPIIFMLLLLEKLKNFIKLFINNNKIIMRHW